MPTYTRKSQQINGHNFNWTISTSSFDFSYRWISVPEAQIGHFHFHINSQKHRTQVWLLEKRGWEEYFITGRTRCLTSELEIDGLVRGACWIDLVVRARNGET